jgi:osmotically-inducible protein OsmY
MNRILAIGMTALCGASMALAQASGGAAAPAASASSEQSSSAYGNRAYDAGAHPTDAATLQSEIEAALRNDSSLSSSRVAVKVDASTIELSGSTPSAKEKLTAERLARSFAIDRKVDDKLMVAGQSAAGEAAPALKP